ncbi:MAG: hypothetical protein LBU53_04175 [Zoogloeaceae bacterium]|nr:hypothetical protein [Zoogloeaceae bacterium]
MKKFAWVVLALLVALVAGSVYFLRDEPLTPLAEQALNYQPAPVPAEQNAFVGLVGLTAPAGSDFVQMGEEIIGLVHAKQAPKPEVKNLAFSVKEYSYSCAREITENCLDEIRADAENIKKLLDDNQELVQRYLKIQEMPAFSNNTSAALFDHTFGFLPYVELFMVSRLLSAKTVLDIKNGDVVGGINWIQKDMELYRRILAATDANLLDKVVAVIQIRRVAILLSLLIEEDRLHDQNENLHPLLASLDSPKKIFRDAMWIEHVAVWQHISRLYNPSGFFELSNFDGQPVEEQGYFEKLQAYLGYYFLFKRNMTMNLDAEIRSYVMEVIDATPPSRLFRETIDQKAFERAGCVNVEELFCKHLKNYFGEVLVLMGKPDYTNYLFRIYDTDALLRLVRAQLEYQLAAKEPGADPLKILASLPPETFNPYTEKPFDFDAERGVIGFQPAARQDKDRRVEIHLSLQ